jgi:uncharacterized protein YaaN involved in tellurite resistance
MLTTQNLLPLIRKNVRELDSAKVQLKIEQLNESDKQAFVNEREKFRTYLHNLEKEELENILARMEPLEAQLDQAIKDLDRELQSINNVIKVISSIRMVTSLLARVVTIF